MKERGENYWIVVLQNIKFDFAFFYFVVKKIFRNTKISTVVGC